MTFRRYAAERMATFTVLMFLAASLVYVMFHVAVHGPNRPRDSQPSRAEVVRYSHYAHESYGDFLWQFVRNGSLGRDLGSGEDITVPIVKRGLITLSVVGGGLILALLIGVPFGLAWATGPKAARIPVSTFAFLAVGLWSAWLALGLSYFVSYKWRLTPPAGYCDFFPPPNECGGPFDWAYHLTLPWITLGLPLSGLYAYTVRDTSLHVRRAGGTKKLAAIASARRVLRDIGFLIGAAVLVEYLFSVPGLGGTFIAALYHWADFAPWLEGVLVWIGVSRSPNVTPQVSET